MVSATLFSPEEERPRFITIKCRPPSQGMCPQPLVSGHFAVDQTELDNRATLMQGRMITQLFQPISWLTSTFFPEMNPVPLINHPCTVCFRSMSMWCSRCQSSWYCTPEHLQSVARL
ncbi:hypothetical protein M405DRAFT_491800 [Rhizopogon salebrosus TDB-379]|nr:hypothetical protein M405DRAFT_491800 [Rhizopogon salebrosus TDB-379]